MTQKTVIYQVFTRLFGNKNATRKPHGTKAENGCGGFSAFTPKALSEIRKMGFTHIWYTGVLEHATQTNYSHIGIRPDNSAVVKGKAGSPYAIKDYYDICPDLADNPQNRMAEFEALVARTHKAGLKAIIDFVPNHVARQYCSDAKPEKVKDLGETDNTAYTFSPDNNFYYLPNQSIYLDFLNEDESYTETPAKVTGNDCFHNNPSRNDWYETVKLNYGVDYMGGHLKCFTPVPDTWLKMCDILLFWASKGVDGFRCDMAEMVPVEFWGWAIRAVKELYPHIVFVAEVYNPNEYRNYVFNGKFDFLYDKVDLYDTLRNVMTGRQPASDITFCWQRIEGLQPHMLNFLENHDEQRIASDFFASLPQAGIPAMLVATAMNTNPMMVYFGQELGERGMDGEGFSGVDGRTTIFDYWQIDCIERWRNGNRFGESKLTEAERSLRAFYSKLLNLANSEPAISEGLFYDLMYANYNNQLFDSTKQYAFLRAKGSEVLLCVANFSPSNANVSVYIPAEASEFVGLATADSLSAIDLLDASENVSFDFSERTIRLRMDGYSGKILKFMACK